MKHFISLTRLAFLSLVWIFYPRPLIETLRDLLWVIFQANTVNVGVYLTDLTFIEDGIPSLTPSELINLNKRTKTAEVIRDIQQYQNSPYLLTPVTELQEYILSNLQGAGDVHDMYERSLEVEPREREDEKIARYATGGRDMSSLTFGTLLMSSR